MGQAPPRPRNVEKVLGKNPFIFRFHVTLQGTNGSHPENRVSQKETYIQTIHFQVRTVSFRECKFQSCSRGLLRSKQETPPPQQSWRKSVVDSHPTMPERRSLGNRLFLEQIGLEGIYFQLCYWSGKSAGMKQHTSAGKRTSIPNSQSGGFVVSRRSWLLTHRLL